MPNFYNVANLRSKTRNLRGKIVGNSGLAAGVGGGPDETSAEVPDRVMTAVGMSRSRAASRCKIRVSYLLLVFPGVEKGFYQNSNDIHTGPGPAFVLPPPAQWSWPSRNRG
jgi:hypothetical protein